MTPGATDIVVLTHNRLDHLVATVDALEQRTPEPIRITIVDNASGPEVRNWLEANRARFHQLILCPANEWTASFQRGIDATSSDPFVITDPDVVVPDGRPSWLAQLHGLMERHPDFGVIAGGLDNVNRPPVLEPEIIPRESVVAGEIVEAPTGTVLMMIRRDALPAPFTTDWRVCREVVQAGRRVGWAKGIRAVHLGWDDHRLHPSHLAKKHLVHGDYREVELIERAPTLTELALAAPAMAVMRTAGVPDEAVLELAWADPVVGAGVPTAVSVLDLDPTELPFGPGAAGGVVLVDPPAGPETVAAAAGVSAALVVAIADLATFGARTAAELAPEGWTGSEMAGPSDAMLALTRLADTDPGIAARLGVGTLDDRERWLDVFANAAFGDGTRRLWVWRRDQPLAMPERVLFDPARVRPWTAVAPPAPRPRRIGPARRAWRRVKAHRPRIQGARA